MGEASRPLPNWKEQRNNEPRGRTRVWAQGRCPGWGMRWMRPGSTHRVHRRWVFPGRACSPSPTRNGREQVGERGTRGLWLPGVTPQIPRVISTPRNHDRQELVSPFRDEATEAKGGEATYSRSHLPCPSWEVGPSSSSSKNEPSHSILEECKVKSSRPAGREPD